jgi:hypothetical protein
MAYRWSTPGSASISHDRSGSRNAEHTKTNFVEADQSGIDKLLVQGLHLRVDIAGGDNSALLNEGGLHDGGMVRVRYKGNDHCGTLACCDLYVET